MRFAGGIRLQICVLAALIPVALSGCGGARARYTSHLQRGKEFLAAGNLKKASVEFRNAIQIQPKDPEALQLEGQVAQQRGNVREAVGLYQAAIDTNPGYEPARASLGKLLIFGGAAQRALDTVAPGLIAHPDSADLLAVRAAARHQLKDGAGARTDAERAVQLAPTNENAVAVLAALYADEHDYTRAISLVTSAVSHVPTSTDLREVLANLYLVTAQPDKAEEQMRKIIELKPLELTPRAQFASHLTRAHKLDAAQGVLEEAVKSFSKLKEQSKIDQARLMLVDFLVAQRSRQQGEKTLREFISQEPDNYDLRFGLGALLQRTGAEQEAIAVYQEVMARDKLGAKGLGARDRIAAIHVARGNDAPARTLISEVLQKNPRDDDALVLRASIELRANDPTSAIGDLRAVLHDQPTSIPLQRTLARAYIEKGDTSLAEETLRAAMQSAPNDPAARIDLAQLLGQTDRAAQALTLLEEGVTKAPDNIQAREALIRAYLVKGDLRAARMGAEKLMARSPDSAAGFYFAGLVAERERRLDESQKNLERALALQPGAIDVLTSLARVEMARGAADAAVATIQTASAHNPGNAQILNLLGELYLERKDFTHAGESFVRATALDPHDWQAHRDLALVKLAENNPKEAIGEYEAALRIAPTEFRVLMELASLYEKQGRLDDAIARYEALYKSNPHMQQFAANNLAMLLITYKTDRASLDRARDLTSGFTSSDNGSLLDTMGWVRFKRGEYQDALPVLERAAARAPDSKVIRYHLAMTELQLGLRDRARSNLESALTGSTDFSGSEEARSALASLKARSS
jgi:tetratricopeptide (TPR) repeat protein